MTPTYATDTLTGGAETPLKFLSAGLEWLEPDGPVETELPVAVVMKVGKRMGVIND